jgi:hypothetical protein
MPPTNPTAPQKNHNAKLFLTSPFRDGNQKNSSMIAIEIGGRRSFFKSTEATTASINATAMLKLRKVKNQSLGIHLVHAAPMSTGPQMHNTRVESPGSFLEMDMFLTYL